MYVCVGGLHSRRQELLSGSNGSRYVWRHVWGLNALFSAFAFSALVVTLWMQRTELRYQRNQLYQQHLDLELQREEMELTRVEHTEHNHILKQQIEYNRLVWEIQLKTRLSDMRPVVAFKKVRVLSDESSSDLYHFIFSSSKEVLGPTVHFTSPGICNIGIQVWNTDLSSFEVSIDLRMIGAGPVKDSLFPVKVGVVYTLEEGTDDYVTFELVNNSYATVTPKSLDELYREWISKMGIK